MQQTGQRWKENQDRQWFFRMVEQKDNEQEESKSLGCNSSEETFGTN